ncbi:MAG: non-homologous end-joining DNA ligase [Gemmatimonadaceae bacterium]
MSPRTPNPSADNGPSKPGRLAEYRRKRDFDRTAEPSGRGERTPRGRGLRFVIQKHAASHLHFDLRLELGGVMKSWAVPKGPSLDPRARRLAIQVEDHPMAYNTFEGTIPAGEYGGGTVMLWDRGRYTVADGLGEDALRRGHRDGKIDFVLDGERLRGAFTLVRTGGASGGGTAAGSKPQWLLIKRSDAHADRVRDVVADVTTSVTSGRTMEEIAQGRRVWTSKRSQATSATRRVGAAAPRRRSPTPSGSSIVAQLEELERDGGGGTLRLAGDRTLVVSHLDKVYFPADGHTKGDIMRYYASMARFCLPPLDDRPLVLRRFPGGIHGQPFYQHKAPPRPSASVRVEFVRAGESTVPRLIGGDIATLLQTVQLGAISTDPWHARVQSLDTADYTVLDLDPGPKAPFRRVVDVARWTKEELDALGLRAAVKTSGSRGLHIYVPLPRGIPDDAALLIAQVVATRVATAHPKEATIQRSVRARRPDSVYVDYLQNIRGKTVAAAYSVRAVDGARVSTPLTWEEVTPKLDPGAFTILTVPARVKRVGDLWKTAMRPPRSLGKLATRIVA